MMMLILAPALAIMIICASFLAVYGCVRIIEHFDKVS